MFSVFSLTCQAISARRLMPSSANSMASPLGLQQLAVLLGERGMRLGEDALEIVRTEGLELHADRQAALQLGEPGRSACSGWKAPEAMNRMWSVLTMPSLVFTVQPSISGSRSRCTPSRETSAPPALARFGDLVDLVDEDDAVLLDRLQGACLELFPR